MVPSELKACAKVRRLCAVSGVPRIEIRGLATTWITVMPVASTNSASRNMTKTADKDAGMNSRQPVIMVRSPMTAARM